MTDSEVFSAYLGAKSSGETITDLSKRLKMTRNQLYRVVARVRHGNPARAKICIEKGRFACLWEWKYRSLFDALPKDRKPATVDELRKLIRRMYKDKFPVKQIARLLGKDRSTVLHHLGK